MRKDMENVFEKLRDGKADAEQASQMNITAARILAALKVQLAYHAMRGEKPEIPFLDDGSTRLKGNVKALQLRK